jgi:hypothetical protein
VATKSSLTLGRMFLIVNRDEITSYFFREPDGNYPHHLIFIRLNTVVDWFVADRDRHVGEISIWMYLLDLIISDSTSLSARGMTRCSSTELVYFGI